MKIGKWMLGLLAFVLVLAPVLASADLVECKNDTETGSDPWGLCTTGASYECNTETFYPSTVPHCCLLRTWDYYIPTSQGNCDTYQHYYSGTVEVNWTNRTQMWVQAFGTYDEFPTYMGFAYYTKTWSTISPGYCHEVWQGDPYLYYIECVEGYPEG